MIAILAYNAGNSTSVLHALASLGAEATLTDDPALILGADRVILPGVGHARPAMEHLRAAGLHTLLPQLRQPFLGICLGMQLLCRHSQEGDTPCLGMVDAEVARLPDTGLVPHMGWNSVTGLRGPLFSGIPEGSDFYFVHSYAVQPCAATAAEGNYLTPFSAALWQGNFHATQFHPEKSAQMGLRLLHNFLTL